MNFIAYCDGHTSLFDICKLTNIDLETINKEFKLLKSHDLMY